MKKVTIVSSLLFLSLSWNMCGQVLDQNAAWPNPNWNVTEGQYLNLDRNLTMTSQFAYSMFLISGVVQDVATAESPVIDLTAAFNAGETQIAIDGYYSYNKLGSEMLELQYWDASVATWKPWPYAFLTNSFYSGVCNGPKEKYETVPLDISGFTATQLSSFKYRFYFKEGATTGGFCFNAPRIFSISCGIPKNLAVTDITGTTADFAWGGNPVVPSWDVDVVLAGFPPNAVPSDPGIATNSFQKTGLSHSTDYQFYVRANCNVGASTAYAGPYSFSTPDVSCGQLFIHCYSASDGLIGFYITDNASNYLVLTISSGITESGADDLVVYDGYLGNGNELYRASGDLSGEVITSETGMLALYMEANSSIDCANGDEPYHSAPLNYTIACTPTPPCASPTNLAASEITSSSAKLDWMENNTATTWDVEIVPAGQTPSGTPDFSDVVKPFTATGLNADTDYEFYVRSDCYIAYSGAYGGPFAFSTEYIASVPWSQDFENSGNIPNYMEQGSGNQEDWLFSDTATSGVGYNGQIIGFTESQGYFAYVEDLCPWGENTTLLSPFIDVSTLAQPELSFFLLSHSNYNNVDFSVDVFDGANWNNNVFFSNSDTRNGGWEKIFVDLSTLTITGPIRIRFVVDEPPGCIYTVIDDSVAIDDISVHEKPTCVQPLTNENTVSQITNTSAMLDWQETGTATTWDIEVVLTGTLPTGTPTDAGITIKPYTKTGLLGNTDYTYYVRSACTASDKSFWTGPFFFSTLCDPVGSIQEDFESTPLNSLPECWRSLAPGNASVRVRPGNGFLGSDYLLLSVTYYADGYAILPELNNLNAGTYQLRFRAKTDTGTQLVLGTLANPEDGNTFTPLQSFATTTSYQNHTLSLNPGNSDTFLAFKGTTGNNGAYIMIDEVFWEPIPTCPQPTNPSGTLSTATTVDLIWNESGSATQWQVEYGTEGFQLGTGTLVNDQDGTPALGITGLAPDTKYEFYIRSDCGGTDQSFWSGPVSLATPCLPTGAFGQNFDALPVNALPDCWTSIIVSPNIISGAGASIAQTSNSFSVPNCLDITTFEDYHELLIYTISPQLTDLAQGTHQLRFRAKKEDGVSSTSSINISIGTMSDPNDENSYSLFQTLLLTDSYQEIIIPFNFTGTDDYIAFKADFAGQFVHVFIDDLFWEPLPTCKKTESLSVSNIMATSADLGWAEIGTATSWEIEYGPAGFVQGTGTMVNDTDGVVGENISGLIPDSAYGFYVRADCGGGDLSYWSGPFGFNTICASLGNFTENFDSYSDGDFPYCWTQLSTVPSVYGEAEIFGFFAFSGSNALAIYGSSSTKILVIPPIFPNVPLGTHQMRFQARLNANVTLEVGTMSDPADHTTFSTVRTITNNGDTYHEYIVPFVGPTTDTYIAFRGSFKNNGIVRLFIDDLTWEPIPACTIQHFMTVSDITATTAKLDWTEVGSASLWDVYVVPSGIAPPTTSTTPTDVGIGKPYTKTGLVSNTDYEFYVQSHCSGDAFSSWSEPRAFTTMLSCVDIFYDSGGPTGNYANGEITTTTIYPSVPGHKVSVEFTVFDIEDNYDAMYVYNGTYTTDPLFDSGAFSTYSGFPPGGYDGSGNPPGPFTSTDASGALTFVFMSNSSTTEAGWEGIISCGPSCPFPNNLTIANITATTANLGWTETGSATAWDVHVVPAGSSAPIMATTPSDPNLSLNPYTKTGLASNTDYEFYVRADCGSGYESFWSGPYAFRTPLSCGDDFYDSGGPLNTYLTEDSVYHFYPSAGNSTKVTFTAFDVGTSDALYVYDGPDTNSPLIDSGNPAIPGSGLPAGGYNGTSIPGPFVSTHPSGMLTFVLRNYGYYFQFSGWEATTSCVPFASCPYVTELTASEITDNSAILEWNDWGANGLWDVHVVFAGSPAPIFTTVPSDPNISLNPYAKTGLSNSTDYEFYVRSDCGGNNLSSWAGPYAFRTLCNAFIAPWLDNVETHNPTTNLSESNCWAAVSTSSYDWNIGNGSTP